MYCPNCGTEFADEANFCPKCGTRRPQPKAASESSTEQPVPPAPASDPTPTDAQSAKRSTDATASASGEVPPTKKKNKLLLILGTVGVVVVALIVIAALRGGKDSSEIFTVRNGYLGEYTDMTVDEILDGYYSGLLGYEPGDWDSGVTDSGKTIVQAEYINEELGSVAIQFSMLDDDCFKVTAFADPLEVLEEPSDLLAVLNKIYVASYEAQYPQEEIGIVEAELLERLAAVNATSVRYGASKDYIGDRSHLYELFGDTQLEMNAARLLDAYGLVSLPASPDIDTDSDSPDFSDPPSAALFSGGTFATVSDASSAYENGGIVVDLTVSGDQVMYTVTSISSSQRIASISGVADQGSTIYASGDDGWGNIVKGNIAVMDDDFISVEFEVVTANADAMWDLDCPYTILTRCSETGTTANTDTAYSSGQEAAWNVYSTAMQGTDGYCVAILYNTEDQDAAERAAGFYEEAVSQVGFLPWDIYTYPSASSDFMPYILKWQDAGVNAVYLASTDTEELDALIPLLLVQCDLLGFYPDFFDADGYELHFTIDDMY